jgi:hypothetical protein
MRAIMLDLERSHPMAFMVPEYSNAAFVEVTGADGESRFCQASLWPEIEAGETVVQTFKGKWFCHLTAPGYMDQTDWSGPFDTEGEAREHIRETFDVDPDTGEGEQ